MALLDHAYASLRRLAGAKPVVGEATAAAEEIERVHLTGPFTVAIAGEPGPRAAFLDFITGAQLFDPARRPPAGMVLSIRRGPATLCRARHRDGSVEELRLPVPVAGGDDDARAAAERACAEQEAALVAAWGQLPPLLRAPPPWWAVWAWLVRWVLTLRYRRFRAELAAGFARLTEARRQLGSGEAASGPSVEESRRRFVDTVRALSDAGARGDGVERLFIDLADGPLPEDVVVIELRPGAGADSLEHAGVDACLVVGGIGPEVMQSPLVRAALAARGRVFFTGDPATGAGDARLRPLGGVAAACGSLRGLLVHERARRLGQRAADVLRQGRAILDDIVEKAEAGFADRLARLEIQRISDPDAFVSERLNRATPLVVERVHQLIAQLTVELGTELARLTGEWSAQLAAAGSADALRAAAAAIDEQSPAALQAARDRAQHLIASGLSGGAHDLYPEIMADLPHPPGGADQAPAPLAVELSLGDAGAGTRLGSVAPRLRSLFRAHERTRTEVLERLTARMTHLEQIAAAGLLDAEPQLVHALAEPLASTLQAAVDGHAAWLDGQVAAERAAIDGERARLAPLARVRDDAAADQRRLAELAAALGD